MKQHKKIKNPEPRSLSEVLKECHNLVSELQLKLKNKSDYILKLQKDLDMANEECQLIELKYNKLKERGELNDRSK
tara:strand:- start:304 stop:531 length:228 start_codon:yes stop_codon:yes gene_type:complete